MVVFFDRCGPRCSPTTSFANRLASEYPSYRHALWESRTRRPGYACEVSDVGFIYRLKFRRLFNALLPEDDPSHEIGVPEHNARHIQNISGHIDKASLLTITVRPESTLSLNQTSMLQDDFSPGLVYVLREARRRSTVLSLLVNAQREDTRVGYLQRMDSEAYRPLLALGLILGS